MADLLIGSGGGRVIRVQYPYFQICIRENLVHAT